MLAGHTDTVPFDEAAWSQDPFAMAERDDRFYGLGACDMKGFFPVALSAAAAFAGRKLRAPLVLAATCDEESSMAGGRFLLESGKPRAEAAIIGEPTGLKPIHAHKGFMLISIQLKGAAGHSSQSSPGPQRAGRHARGDVRVDPLSRGARPPPPEPTVRA